MSDISSFIGKFRTQTGQPDASVNRVTKRPRESLVCNQCRKSKLRCDKERPCSSCVKKDEATACSYQRFSDTRSDTGRHAVAEDRLLHLESVVKHLIHQQQPQSSQPVDNSAAVKPITPPELPHDLDRTAEEPRSDAGGSKYVGATHWSAILDDIQELKVVLGASSDVETVEGTAPSDHSASAGEVIFGLSNDYSLQDILSHYLPSKIEADRYLSIYFGGETYIVPFIHTFYFQRQYQEFWADQENVNPLWLSMLFSICYMGSLIGGAIDSRNAPQDEFLTSRSNLHLAAGQCLVIGEYHRPQQLALEALAMYGHCKNIKSLDPSREAGAILGMVVRMAYELGYHRDPDSFGNLTVFEGEMRRRFWAAVTQMNLMMSFMLGLPSNICLDNCDTKSPQNLLDSDFDTHTTMLPPSRPENEPTKLLWFIIKDRQMISFSKVCQDALSFKEKSASEILRLDEEIQQMASTIPDVLRARPFSDSLADPPFLILTRIYIEFIHLKSLCVLHRKYMARGNVFSTVSCIQAGTRLVGRFIDMHNEFSPGCQLYTVRGMLTNFTLNDFHMGIMVLCLVVHIRRKTGGGSDATINAATEAEVLTLLEQAYAICLEKASLSRDARRVAHAIRLTLNGSKGMRSSEPRPAPSVTVAVAAASSTQSAMSDAPGTGLASLSLQSQPNFIPGDEAAFGLLDPFNFMGNDFENIDWTMFDTQGSD